MYKSSIMRIYIPIRLSDRRVRYYLVARLRKILGKRFARPKVLIVSQTYVINKAHFTDNRDAVAPHKQFITNGDAKTAAV